MIKRKPNRPEDAAAEFPPLSRHNLEGLNAATVTQDFFAVYQDTFGNTRVAIVESDGAEGGADFTVTDAFILEGVSLTGVSNTIDTGDFIVA